MFEEWCANDACEFIEKLPHVEGEWETPTIVLHPSHVFFVVNLFGFRKRNPDGTSGTRRFTTALLAVARKNAKSTLAAAILLYCFCCEDDVGPQAITGATTGSQARVVFNIAKRMVEKTPDLREWFSLEVFSNSIANWTSGGSFKPINAKASTQDGLNPSYVELDEIHAHKNHDLLNVLQSAAGARKNPLWLYTTTEGYETPGPWPELRTHARKVLQEVFTEHETDHFFCLIFAVDDDIGEKDKPGYRPADDDFDETTWIKANPLMDVNDVLADEVRKAAAEAKSMPGRHAEFRIKRLNRQSASAASWVKLSDWQACASKFNIDQVLEEARARGAKIRCAAAIDGASTTDLFSWRMIWYIDDLVYTKGRIWVTEGSVKQRTERNTTPYAAWVAAGYMTQLPGKTLDYTIIEESIVADCAKYNPGAVGYDPWNIRDLVTRLEKRLPKRRNDKNEEVSILEEFRQGVKSFSPAMKECERLYVSGLLKHGNSPVLNWCISNVVPRYDENLNIAPDRKHSADKIDDAVALFMALGVDPGKGSGPKTYKILII